MKRFSSFGLIVLFGLLGIVYLVIGIMNSKPGVSLSDLTDQLRPVLVPGVTIANEVVVWGHVNTDYAESPCTYLAELHLTDAAFADFCRLNKLTVDQFHAMLGEDHFANVDWWRVPTDGRKQFDGSSRYASGTIDVREGTRILYHGFQTYGGSTYYFRQGKGPTSLAKL